MSEIKYSKEFFSKKIRAGKRTYFFDIKSTKDGDYYITITESKKIPDQDRQNYIRRTIFLYKEDIKNFQSAFGETISTLEELLSDYNFENSKKEES